MEIKVEITPNIDTLVKKFAGCEQLLVSKLKEGVYGYALLVERGSKIFTPVDTGRLRASIGTSMGILAGGLSAVIAPHVTYAVYVHQGTRYMAGRAFMEWGLNAYRRDGDKLIISKINEALKSLEAN